MIFPAIKPSFMVGIFQFAMLVYQRVHRSPPGAPNRVEQRHSGVVQQCHGANVTRFHRAAIHPQHILSCCRPSRTDVTGRANHQGSYPDGFFQNPLSLSEIEQRLKSCNWLPHWWPDIVFFQPQSWDHEELVKRFPETPQFLVIYPLVN